MRHLAVMLIFAALSLANSQGQETNATNSSPHTTSTNSGLHLLLTFDKTTFTRSDPISFSIVLTNSSSRSIPVSTAYLGVNPKITLTNAAGVAVSIRQNRHGDHFSGPSHLDLSAHDQITVPARIRDFYDTEPGVYRVAVNWARNSNPKQQDLHSKEVTIKILPTD